MNFTYTPSKLLPGEAGTLRQHGFTRWMSRDLLQAATDFLKNLHLLPIYAECSSDNLHRYLCWHPPQGALVEARSGRTLGQFEEFDRGNIERGWPLLSLHINECDVYSAVWISVDHYETARKVLTGYGITSAVRTLSP
jgi:hypothetical protein